MIKVLIVVNMLAILYFLFSSLKHLMLPTDQEQVFLAELLGKRMQASLICFVLIIITKSLGWIE
jgi:hypothetical protein